MLQTGACRGRARPGGKESDRSGADRRNGGGTRHWARKPGISCEQEDVLDCEQSAVRHFLIETARQAVFDLVSFIPVPLTIPSLSALPGIVGIIEKMKGVADTS
jgi:hypothetical protein